MNYERPAAEGRFVSAFLPDFVSFMGATLKNLKPWSGWLSEKGCSKEFIFRCLVSTVLCKFSTSRIRLPAQVAQKGLPQTCRNMLKPEQLWKQIFVPTVEFNFRGSLSHTRNRCFDVNFQHRWIRLRASQAAHINCVGNGV